MDGPNPFRATQETRKNQGVLVFTGGELSFQGFLGGAGPRPSTVGRGGRESAPDRCRHRVATVFAVFEAVCACLVSASSQNGWRPFAVPLEIHPEGYEPGTKESHPESTRICIWPNDNNSQTENQGTRVEDLHG